MYRSPTFSHLKTSGRGLNTLNDGSGMAAMGTQWASHGHKPAKTKVSGPCRAADLVFLGADDEIRTRDPHLGKVMLYQLSHIRVVRVAI